MKKVVFVAAAICLPLVSLHCAQAEEPAAAAPATTAAAPAAAPTKAEQYNAALKRVAEFAQAEKWDEARAELKRAESLASTFDERITILRQMGQTYDAQGQPEKAWGIWRQVLAMPDLPREQNVMLRTVLATSLRQAKNWNEARLEAERVMREAPVETPAEVLFTAQSIGGDAFLETGQYEQARQAYDRALNLASGQSVFLIFQSTVGINIAKSYLRQGQATNARIYLRTALSALPLAAQSQDAAPMVAFLQSIGQQMIAESYRDEGDKANATAAYRVLIDNPATPEPLKAEAEQQIQMLKKSAN